MTQFSLHGSKLACMPILPLYLHLKAPDLPLLLLPVQVQIPNSPFPLVSLLVPGPFLALTIVVETALLLLTSLALLPKRGSFGAHLRQGLEQFGSSRAFLGKFTLHCLNALAYLQHVTHRLRLGTLGLAQASAAAHLW